jgi:hypothetical protein|tara:strand:+ start:223 stop:1428 length:1206 start_codon:yes stop_codon:yes gene_type:complete
MLVTEDKARALLLDYPNNAVILNILSVCLITQNKFDEPEIILNNLIDNYPKYVEPYINLGALYDRQHKKDEALAVFNKCLEFEDIHESSKEILHLNVGNLLLDQTLYVEAIENYLSSLKINSKNINAHNKIADAYMFIEDRINAIKHYEEVLKLDTTKDRDDNFCFALGMAYKENLNFDKASKFIKKIDLNTNIKIEDNNTIVDEPTFKSKIDDNFIASWKIKDDILTDKIINFFENNQQLQQKGRAYRANSDNIKSSIDITIRPNDLQIEKYKFLNEYIDTLNIMLLKYFEKYKILSNFKLDMGAFNIQKYEKGGHFKGVHSERMGVFNMDRVFAWMTYLNDVEEGGSTYFPHFDLRIKPEKGRTLIWPSEWTHAHCGEVVESNEKYIITGWFEFKTNNS